MPDTIAVHWEAAAPRADHAQCAGQVEDIRRYHISTGYSDIAYSFLVCNHGQVFVGRGWDRQSAATCNSYWNSRAWAVCWMGGPGYSPTPAALAGIRSVIDEAARRGAHNVIGHRDACSTQCPGDELWNWVHSGYPAGSPEPAPPKNRANTGALGMLIRDKTTSTIWWVVPGGVHPETDGNVVNRKRFVGCPYFEVDNGLHVIAWAIDFHAWDHAANDFIYLDG